MKEIRKILIMKYVMYWYGWMRVFTKEHKSSARGINLLDLSYHYRIISLMFHKFYCFSADLYSLVNTLIHPYQYITYFINQIFLFLIFYPPMPYFPNFPPLLFFIFVALLCRYYLTSIYFTSSYIFTVNSIFYYL